jgi:hypothetical protein
MNRQKWVLIVASLLLIGTTAGVLLRMKTHQKLGTPGVKTVPIANSKNVLVDLPEKALDYTSENVEVEKIVSDTLPPDTSFGQRLYKAPDGFEVRVNVVLMGSDRTSLHKPQFCLRGSGWVIDKAEPTTISMTRPCKYDLPVTKMLLTPEKPLEAGPARGIYVYWFVADNEYTPQHWQRMWWMARDLVKTGVLQRWAYITYFCACAPGQEEAAFERIKSLIAASVPDFQLAPRVQ